MISPLVFPNSSSRVTLSVLFLPISFPFSGLTKNNIPCSFFPASRASNILLSPISPELFPVRNEYYRNWRSPTWDGRPQVKFPLPLPLVSICVRTHPYPPFSFPFKSPPPFSGMLSALAYSPRLSSATLVVFTSLFFVFFPELFYSFALPAWGIFASFSPFL